MSAIAAGSHERQRAVLGHPRAAWGFSTAAVVADPNDADVGLS
jgi:hypothetical protein